MIDSKEFELRKTDLIETINTLLLEAIKSASCPNSNREIMREHAAINVVVLLSLIEAMVYSRDVFVVCEESPRYLQAGENYYSLYFVNQNYKVEKFFLSHSIMELFGAKRYVTNSRSEWTFPSGIIALSTPAHMGRNFDAFERLAEFLANVGVGSLQEVKRAIAEKAL
ncbi:hypothetical protein FD723_40115 (plasmid) [Nostoc sp. C052]|uniref:hypothetical protein n=1 Tax=Nostoc sp. C052 TaxID=2576902 RepID=UPI0015C39BF8|nr:hypothetical protein [Nostoc sp. C052]QLE46419.1 hypothetical protein FD723_40115 [Nostoc sp. C052]